ncbi:molybdopterin molybdotransferase MoeA [Citricoccus muralis]|uniref:Molybdopterin molybdenumtransferase n=1 Tax=Citricoccus muralis TaxID=169134 RepID=A0ABY8H7K5_9MICC|nr:gephyrin-like molybdotransferase Glp [Citricoccus muralis]WFP16675.1 molybdopterin molybdotransferase MoeA [Citricoccus muralis]
MNDDGLVSAAAWGDWLRAQIATTAVVERAVTEAHGLVLAEDAVARYDLPLWANSAMDGYAVRAADLGVGVSLRVLGEVPAGSGADPEMPVGCAVRIMTGAAVPTDADAVIPVERTRSADGETWARDTVQILEPVAEGANIRRPGEDTRAGTVLAAAGTRLTAARQAALAAAGVERVRVHAAPRVAVVVTGSELCAPGQVPQRGQIPESNSVLIAGLLREVGLEPVAVRHSRDDAAGARALLAELARGMVDSSGCDLILTTGGIGPGTHDVVRIALESEPGVRGAHVAVRPGAPQRAGRLTDGPLVIALPGNPVSAAVSFELFVRPVLLGMQGAARTERPRVQAVAGADWRGKVGRLQVLPVRVDDAGEAGRTVDAPQLCCVPAVNPRGVSHAVGGHGTADGYALVAEDRGDVRAGETVPVILVGS